MLFEDMLLELRSGSKFYREAWTNNGDFIFMFPGAEDTIIPRDSLHSVMIGRLSTNMMTRIDKKEGGSIIVGWTPSSSDLFGDDWVEKNA